MTLLALRYDTRRGRFGRVALGDANPARDAAADPAQDPFDIAREMRMQELRDLIARDAYRIDAQAVAGAIVARLAAGGHVTPSDPA